MKQNRRRCKSCKEWMHNPLPSQIVCGYECSLKYAQSKEAKKALKSKAQKAKKEFSKNDRAHMRKEAQRVFNAFIRERDKGLPCVSCGEFKESYDAGHYRSRGAAPQLSFDEDNVHAQCYKCNRFLGGNLTGYRVGLIQKIGLEKVEWLENNNEVKRFTVDDFKNIIETYNKKRKEIK